MFSLTPHTSGAMSDPSRIIPCPRAKLLSLWTEGSKEVVLMDGLVSACRGRLLFSISSIVMLGCKCTCEPLYKPELVKKVIPKRDSN